MQLVEVLAKVLRLRKEGNREEAEQQIRYFYSCLKVDEDVSKLSLDEVLQFLEKEKKFTTEQIELFAFILKEQGELTEDDTLRVNYFQKAHFLLEKVELRSVAFSMDRQMKLTELKSYLN